MLANKVKREYNNYVKLQKGDKMIESSKNKIIDEIISKLKKNQGELKKVEKIDKRYNNININLKEIIEYIENYKEKKIEEKNQKIIAIYRGNPYITVDLCMQAILSNCKIILIIEDVMYGVNTIITKIFQSISELIILKNCESNSSIIQISHKIDKVIVIGDVGRYQTLRKSLKNIRFIPYNNIAVYLDDDKFEEIAQKICEYAEEYEDDIECYTRNLEDISKDIFVDKVLLLTENKKLIEKANKILKDKTILINRNPLEKLSNKLYI